MVLQKRLLIKIRNCISSIFSIFWKVWFFIDTHWFPRAIPIIMDYCCRVFVVKNLYYELFHCFRRSNYVNFFPFHLFIMKNCLSNYNLNHIHIVSCNNRIFLMILWYFWRCYYLNPIYIFGCTGKSLRIFIHFSLLCFCIKCFVKNIHFWNDPYFFIDLFPSLSNKYILYLSFGLFCDESTSLFVNFLLQFSFSEFFVIFGLFSSSDWPYYNFWKYYSHSFMTVSVSPYVFVIWEINCLNKNQKLLFINCGFV